MSAVDVLDGPDETEIVARLLAVRGTLGSTTSDGRAADVFDVKDRARSTVNDDFERRLAAIPSIAAHLGELRARA